MILAASIFPPASTIALMAAVAAIVAVGIYLHMR